MSQLLLINPRRKRRHSKRRARARNPKRRHVARSVTRRTYRRRARAVNPRRRRHHVARFRNPVRRRRVSRRGGRGFSVKGLTSSIMPAAVGAVGAVGLDVAYGYLGGFLPASVSGNVYLSAAVKLAGAYGLGVLAGKVMGQEKGRAVTLGAMTVVSYGIIKSLVAQFAPNVPGLHGYPDGFQGMGAYMPNLSGYNPAPLLKGPAPSALGAYMNMGGLDGVNSEMMF
jgi:hypothetical protein